MAVQVITQMNLNLCFESEFENKLLSQATRWRMIDDDLNIPNRFCCYSSVSTLLHRCYFSTLRNHVHYNFIYKWKHCLARLWPPGVMWVTDCCCRQPCCDTGVLLRESYIWIISGLSCYVKPCYIFWWRSLQVDVTSRISGEELEWRRGPERPWSFSATVSGIVKEMTIQTFMVPTGILRLTTMIHDFFSRLYCATGRPKLYSISWQG